MEFKDYYEILQINQSASVSEIKAAFKVQAIKWHPDKNPNVDTTAKMQEINEAKLILLDAEARQRYDIEYIKYKAFYSNKQKQQQQAEKSRQQSESSSQKEKKQTQENEYEFDDEVLRNWMRNARRQAVDLAKQTIKEVGELSVIATKAAGAEMLQMFAGYFVVGLIFFIIFKACSS